MNAVSLSSIYILPGPYLGMYFCVLRHVFCGKLQHCQHCGRRNTTPGSRASTIPLDARELQRGLLVQKLFRAKVITEYKVRQDRNSEKPGQGASQRCARRPGANNPNQSYCQRGWSKKEQGGHCLESQLEEWDLTGRPALGRHRQTDSCRCAGSAVHAPSKLWHRSQLLPPPRRK